MQSIHAGVAAPEFEATTLDGRSFKLSDLRGKIVLLDFWATWCGPCLAEMPNLKSLHDKFGKDNFAVVGISFDRDAATAQKFVTGRGMPWTQVWAANADEGPIASRYGVGGIPATFLIGADGKVIERDLRGEGLAKTVAREARKLAGGDVPKGNWFAGAVQELLGDLHEVIPEPLPRESPEARAVLDATLARYRGLSSYQDGFCSQARLLQANEPVQEGQIEGSLTWTGRRIAAKSNLVHIYADGQEVTQYWPFVGRYTRQEQPASLADALQDLDWSPYPAQGVGIHPLAAMLADQGAVRSPFLVVTGVKPATRADRAGRVLEGLLRLDGLTGGKRLPFTAFIDARGELFEEFRLDYTEAYRDALRESYEGDPDAVKQAEIVITLRDIQTNGPVDAAAFDFSAPGAREFKMFQFGDFEKAPQPEELRGRAAPALAGATLDGAPFDLATQRGKVVLVLYWATLAPQAEAVLRGLQELATTSPAPVTLVGVNRNGTAGAEAVRRVLERSGASFPQLPDADGHLGDAWNVTCLPLIYVVDPKGFVRGVYLTWSEETRKALSDVLGQAARGDTVDLQTIAALPSTGSAAGGLVLKVDDEPLDDGSVHQEVLDQLRGSRWNMSEQDVDGDGEAELIFPDWQSGFSILKPSTGEIRHIRLSGVEQVSVQTVRAVHCAGEWSWLCTANRFNMGSSSAGTRSLVLFFSSRGDLLWRFEPEVQAGREAQVQATAGDLDGDGRLEYVLGLTSYLRQQESENRYTLTEMNGRLIWLDDTGRRIAEHELESQVDLLYVSEASSGKPASVLCLSGGQLQRYTLAAEQRAD